MCENLRKIRNLLEIKVIAIFGFDDRGNALVLRDKNVISKYNDCECFPDHMMNAFHD